LARQRIVVFQFGDEPIGARRARRLYAQLAQPGDGVLGGGKNLGTPLGVEMLDAKQLGRRLLELVLDREQRRQRDIARVQLDLGHQPIEDLILDEAEVADGETDGVVVRVGIAERGEEVVAPGQHPPPLGGDQHRQLLHKRLRAVTRCGRTIPSRTHSRADAVNNRLNASCFAAARGSHATPPSQHRWARLNSRSLT